MESRKVELESRAAVARHADSVRKFRNSKLESNIYIAESYLAIEYITK